MTKSYRSSHSTENFVPKRIPNGLIPNFKNVEITFFLQETPFCGENYERKISEKIPDVSLDSTYLFVV